MSQEVLHNDVLLVQCAKGNQLAQMKIYDNYYHAMYNTAYRIVKNHDDAEDIMQESFLSAFTKLDSFDKKSSFGSWLKRIVINNSIHYYRIKQKYNETSLERIIHKVEDGDVATAHDIDKMKAQKVLKTMQSLKENYRVSLTLHLIEGYDYEEICDIMNISYNNCRTMISRAKESLRKKMIET
ncbi:RNA polymerase sigma factor [Leptobacterium sp. I13]|uniref:RNA polymerase sigma factor n=1 Tax=Leptobacterium meishanense TaxID=3128904 RepID=UPI0030ED435C